VRKAGRPWTRSARCASCPSLMTTRGRLEVQVLDVCMFLCEHVFHNDCLEGYRAELPKVYGDHPSQLKDYRRALDRPFSCTVMSSA
jgi:hypothetical protein